MNEDEFGQTYPHENMFEIYATIENIYSTLRELDTLKEDYHDCMRVMRVSIEHPEMDVAKCLGMESMVGAMGDMALIAFKKILSAIKIALIKLKEFILYLFRRIFNERVRMKFDLNTQLTRLKTHHIVDEIFNGMKAEILPYNEFVAKFHILNDFYYEIKSVAGLSTAEHIQRFYASLTLLHYSVDERDFTITPMATAPNLKIVTPSQQGWNIETITDVTELMINELSGSQELAKLSKTFENKVDDKVKIVNRLLASDDSSTIEKEQTELDEFRKFSTFITACVQIHFKELVILEGQLARFLSNIKTV